jgi:hypothetical protein
MFLKFFSCENQGVTGPQLIAGGDGGAEGCDGASFSVS